MDSDLATQLYQYAFSKPIPDEDHVVLHGPSLLRVTGDIRFIFDKNDFCRYESLSWFGLYFRLIITEIHHQEWAPKRLVRWAHFEGAFVGLLLIILLIAFCVWLPLHFKGKT